MHTGGQRVNYITDITPRLTEGTLGIIKSFQSATSEIYCMLASFLKGDIHL